LATEVEVTRYWETIPIYGNMDWEFCAAPNNTGLCFKMGSYVCEPGVLFQSFNIAKSCATLLSLQSGYYYDVINETRNLWERAGSCYQDHRVMATGRTLAPLEKAALSARFHTGEPPSLIEMLSIAVVGRMIKASMMTPLFTLFFYDKTPLPSLSLPYSPF